MRYKTERRCRKYNMTGKGSDLEQPSLDGAVITRIVCLLDTNAITRNTQRLEVCVCDKPEPANEG